MQPPSGYESGGTRDARFVVRQGLAAFVRQAIEAHGSLGEFATRHSRAAMPGRGMAHVVDGPDGRLVVRHYRRGGAVARALGDRYARIGRPRPFHELSVSAVARQRGITTPAVAAAVVHDAGLFYRGDIATDLVPDAVTLADATFGEARQGAPERRAAWHATGRLVRDSAAAGIVHADLNLRNVLIAWRNGECVPYLLDLDRCTVADGASPRGLTRMRARLLRSARRFAERTGQAPDTEVIAFEEGIRG